MAELRKYVSKYTNYQIISGNRVIRFERRRYQTDNPAEQKIIEGLKQFGTPEVDFDRATSPAAQADVRVVQLTEEVAQKDAKILELEAELEKLRALAEAEADVSEQPKKSGKKRR
jgi:hypothetical protein